MCDMTEEAESNVSSEPDNDLVFDKMAETGVTDEGSSSTELEPPKPKFVCSPCSKDGITVEAVCRCVDCMENFCTQCLASHQKFNIMIDHTIIQGEEMDDSEKTKVPVLPKERCTAHNLRGTDMFCEDHRALCCGRCIVEHHRPCKDVVYIPQAATGIKDSEELEKTKTNAVEMIAEIKQLKLDRENDIQRIEQEKEDSFRQISTYKENILKHLNKLEEKAMREVSEQVDKIKLKFEGDIKRLDELLADVEKNAELLQNFASENESQLFVYLKKGKRLSEDVFGMKDELSSRNYKVQFSLDENILGYLKKVKSIGLIPVTFTLRGKYSVKNDNVYFSLCDLTGCCVMDNGSVIVSDMGNKRLILLDKSYKVVQRIQLADGPTDICVFDKDKLAVTLANQVQFANVLDTILLKSVINVCAEVWGIAHSSGHLFVSCQVIDKGEIRIFNENGSSIRNIPLQVDTCRPNQIAITGPNDDILVADMNGTVILFNQDGTVKRKFENDFLKGPNCVRKISTNTVLVIGRMSHNLLQVSLEGTSSCVVLGKNDGLKSPYSMAYDVRNNKLILVSDETDKIAVYYVT